MEVQIGNIVYCWFPLEEIEVENEYHEPYIKSHDILFGNYRKGIVLKIEGSYNQRISVDIKDLKEFNINSEILFENGVSTRFNYLNSRCNNIFLSTMPPKFIVKKYETKTKQIIEELNFVDVSILESNSKIAKRFEAFKKWAKNEIESI